MVLWVSCHLSSRLCSEDGADKSGCALQMDGFEPNEGVIVMAATNMQENLDAALMRPGRFDRHVAVPLPDVRGRLEILNYYLQVHTVHSARNPFHCLPCLRILAMAEAPIDIGIYSMHIMGRAARLRGHQAECRSMHCTLQLCLLTNSYTIECFLKSTGA